MVLYKGSFVRDGLVVIITDEESVITSVTSIKTDSWPYINTTELEIVREFNTECDLRRGLKLKQ